MYASKEADIPVEAVDENLHHPTLANEEQDSLEGLINIQELSIAVKNLNNDKSLGSDGYTAKMFKFFFKDVRMFFVLLLLFFRSINCGFERGKCQ